MKNETDLTNRDYSRQSHLIVNSKYAMTKNEINLLLVLLTAIDKNDEDFKNYIFTKRDLEKKTDKNGTVYSYKKPLTVFLINQFGLNTIAIRGKDLIGFLILNMITVSLLVDSIKH